MKLKVNVTPNLVALAALVMVAAATPVAFTAACLQLGDMLDENRSGSAIKLVENPWNVVYLSSLGVLAAMASQAAAAKTRQAAENARWEDSSDA